MANPKRRHSKGRRDQRRANQRLVPHQVVRCKNCNASIRPHTICSQCGYYRGRQVLVVGVS
ncbi:MAG TPA: 50S ribosomal protein L32 [Planctomycetota bacterium]|nr:50S ribosomal protein L32 [Planctomycetota bacterium]